MFVVIGLQLRLKITIPFDIGINYITALRTYLVNIMATPLEFLEVESLEYYK